MKHPRYQQENPPRAPFRMGCRAELSAHRGKVRSRKQAMRSEGKEVQAVSLLTELDTDSQRMKEWPMSLRRLWILSLILAVVASASAGPTAAQEKPRHGGELVFVVPSEPPSYDAHQEETFGLIHPMAPHYSTLLKIDSFDKTGTRPVGDLAESWTISKDALVYTFKLRRGVKFHDGSLMTSRDVKASYDKILKPPAGVKSLRKDTYDEVTSRSLSTRMRQPGLEFSELAPPPGARCAWGD